jgi:hypothetical protein
MKHHSPRDNPFSACAVSTRGKIFRDEQMFICFARGEFPRVMPESFLLRADEVIK